MGWQTKKEWRTLLADTKIAAGRRFACGVVVYDGTMSLSFGDSLFAVPVGALWEES